MTLHPVRRLRKRREDRNERETREDALRVEPPETVGDAGILAVDPVARHRASGWTRRTIWRFVLCGERPQPIPSFTGTVEAPERGRIGIACSGGGIRSAAFGLGALQVLQDAGVLRRARYLAGVSGGSYIAAAFCMVRRTWARGGAQPAKEQDGVELPGWDDSDPNHVGETHPPFFPGSPEEQYLRNRSSYMAPGAYGKIEFGYRLLLGMSVNLLFIGLALAAIAAPLALLYGAIYPSLGSHVVPGGRCLRAIPAADGGSEERRVLCELLPLHIPLALWLAVAALAGAALLLGGASIMFYRLRAFVTQVTEVWSLRLLLLAIGAGALLIGLPLLLSLYRAWGTVLRSSSSAGAKLAGGAREVKHGAQPTGGTSPGAVAVSAGAGVLTLGSAVLLQLRADWVEARKLLAGAGTAQKWWMKLSPALRRGIADLIAGLLGPAMTLALVVVVMSFVLNRADAETRWLVTAATIAFFALVYAFADLNSWSLHSFYRRRLCCAFALKRVALEPERVNGIEMSWPADEQAPAQQGRPQVPRSRLAPLLRRRPRPASEPVPCPRYPPIADSDAGKAEARNFRRLVPISQTAIGPDADGDQDWPTLLVCASANISDTAATPPGRRVTSFTFSPRAMGGPLVGAVRTFRLERACDEARRRYFTLPAAVAMSGAALSPSMGKQTRGPLRFLLALANVRLGVWVPNPRRLESFAPSALEEQPDEAKLRLRVRRAWHRRRAKHYPSPRPSYLLRELLGMNPLNANYLYVTDGGHYENLGLVELLRRGCTEIYCFDASNDDFDAIGDAIALARSELEVQIDIDCTPLQADPTTTRAAKDSVAATITYPGEDAPRARLFYSRLVLTAGVPADVLAYHGKDPRFPHDPTTDQLYTDQRFEAYRALGAKAAKSALALPRGGLGASANGARPSAPAAPAPPRG